MALVRRVDGHNYPLAHRRINGSTKTDGVLRLSESSDSSPSSLRRHLKRWWIRNSPVRCASGRQSLADPLSAESCPGGSRSLCFGGESTGSRTKGAKRLRLLECPAVYSASGELRIASLAIPVFQTESDAGVFHRCHGIQAEVIH